jgi:hypothetical protein
MGIKILSSITTPQGLSLTDLIATFKGSFTLIKNSNNAFVLSGTARFYVDETKLPVDTTYVSITVTESQLSDNLLTLLYNNLKNTYPENEDV